ncbi:hypothetical protein [Pseudotenacibaculum haliotis]|uniref:Uncharacterized protein n=1 Tax=Pseudotenacibaculum haliotis TaxID=1862138 RepID=A0ABW5LLS4_9FLAO
MKIKIAVLFIITFCQYSFSQDIEWSTYDFDSIVYLDMPNEVYEMDTIINNQKLYQIFSKNDSVEFVAQKILLGKMSSNGEVIRPPDDIKSLNKLYSDLIWVFTEPYEQYFGSSKEIIKNDLKGFKLTFKNDNEKIVIEVDLFIVNKSFYTFSYSNLNGLNEADRDLFFNSINFDSKQELKQYHKSPSVFNKYTALTLVTLLLLSFFFSLIKRRA